MVGVGEGQGPGAAAQRLLQVEVGGVVVELVDLAHTRCQQHDWRHYEKTCSGMNSFRSGIDSFQSGMNSFRIGMKSFRIDTGIWGNEKCQKIKLFM